MSAWLTTSGLGLVEGGTRIVEDVSLEFAAARSVVLGIDHPHYGHMALLGPDSRAALARDFA